MPGPLPNPRLVGGARVDSSAEPSTKSPRVPRPPAPKGLAAGGRRLWKAIHDDLDPSLELTTRDLEVLHDACKQQDGIDNLEAAIKQDGEVIDGLHGRKVHPAVIELRQARQAKTRMLATIEMEDRGMVSPASRRARKAAQTRWDMEREKRGARGAA